MENPLRDLVLYCKTYSRDFLRLKRLLASIKKFNVEDIPVYISTPADEYDLLVEILGEEKSFTWLADEEIVSANPNANIKKYKVMVGGLSQAIVKAEFWRLGFSENYLCIDSDSIFIRDFYKSDFLSDEGYPFTILHQNKEYFQLAKNRGMEKVSQELRKEAQRVQSLFERVGPLFYCAPAPFIWSAKVWQSLDAEYLIPRGESLWDLVSPEYPETLIYGEALMKYKAIPLLAIEPLFRVYHYDWQYFLMKRLGETEQSLQQNYLGVIYQSNWDRAFDFGSSRKSALSRLVKQSKHFLRYLQSYI
ncbi:hypothetical protein G6705_00385 [Polynucleobacter paneuropaeus]|nr:hypothetical protein [Polynucleobacter paneuropaeus]MBT8632061.1 hypothetical protein [Polynucleobacter paneuropaeus]QWD14340.1 hypothetical protein G6703_01305 [Polynucleobacter paneuropaeus]